MNKQKYKNLKESDVLEVVQDLCSINVTTTTLDVKNELRRQRFFAEQQDISMLMDRLNDNGDVTWIESGHGYRTYSLVNQQITQQDVLGTSISLIPTSISDDDNNIVTSKKVEK